MEVQTQLLHHNPYDIVKSEPVVDSPPKLLERKNSICPSSDMIFGVSNFIPNNFCANNNSNPTTNNNNNDHLANNNNNNNTNNNNVKLPNDSGRSLAADRKRPYPCNLCPSRFGSKMELEEHQNSHTGMKPFECDVCKARFNRRSTLWNHKRIHSDAKPFVCTVCQMTFKWKNSLKCHKEMHLRKNESSAHLDNDLRQLTYATAAKRRLLQEQENGGNAATSCANSIHSQPLITTTTPKKKNKSNAHNNLSNVHVNNIQQPLQASALIPPSDHSLDIDSSSLDTLVGGHQGNLFLHMYGDVPFLGDVDSRHPMLSGLDDPSMLSSQINSDKSDSPMGTTTAPINVHLPMQINMFNFRPVQPQLPSVHHLTSTSLSLDYSGQPTENSLGHPQYIVAAQPDMMISQHSLGYPQPLDQCVNSILVAGQDYVPNFDYQMLSSNYPMQPNDVDDQQGQQRVPPPDQSHQGRTQAPNVLGQQQRSDELIDEKVLPYEQW